jgi:thiamine-monophosphate kinase
MDSARPSSRHDNMSVEFDLIANYFTRPTPQADLGVGDDAALVRVADGHQLVISSDMSVVGTHFFADAAPEDIGWKSLAVNISDMAAMGANPKWTTLSIALPAIDHTWLSAFSSGFFACAEAFKVDLIGGDTTRGPLNISVTILGEVPTGKALKRSGAQAGDDIWVTGQLGSAALGLAYLQGKLSLESDALKPSIHALCRPTPRVDIGLKIRDFASSCIDISDGLLADLGHLLKASHLQARIDLEKIPCMPALQQHLDQARHQHLILAGGDDYELCFTAPASARSAIEALGAALQVNVTCVGSTHLAQPDAIGTIQTHYRHQPITLLKKGFDHFD